MAANEYYNPSGQGKYRPYENIQPTLPQLPPLPHDDFNSYTSHHAQQPSPYESPISPIQDPAYRPYEPSQHSQNSASSPYYASGGGGRDNEPNPFSDEIPLRQSPSKASGDAAFHDHLPEDPAVMDAPPPSQNGERRRRKKGIMERKIPWVVYTFTFVQVVVFIAELIKAGTCSKRGRLWLQILTLSRCANRKPHRNPSHLQPHDRPLPLRAHQHGRPLSSMHAPKSHRHRHPYRLALSQRNRRPSS